MKLYIQGGEMVSAHGSTDDTWAALHDLRLPESITPLGHNQSYPLAVRRKRNEGFGSTRRLDGFLQELYDTLPLLPGDTSLIVSTAKGAVDEFLRNDSPSQGQEWYLADKIYTDLQLKGKISCVSAACASGTIGIIDGAMRILSGSCSHALVIGIDILSNFVISGFASLKALSPTTCRPFDRKRNGLVLGEGAAWMLLSSSETSFNDSNDRFTLRQWGISCDATHITAPCRYGSGLLRTLRQFGKEAVSVGAINAHGTGTIYNDAMELTAFKAYFDNLPPLCSVKGSIGHCLGAAGVMEALLSIKSLETGVLPPTVGLEEAEERASGSISGKRPIPLRNATILSCNSGFGGINAALLLQKE